MCKTGRNACLELSGLWENGRKSIGDFKNDLAELFELNNNTITISRKKNEKAYRIAIGGGRSKSKQIKASRIEELL